MKLYPLPNLTTPTTGNCNNWVTSLDSPINYAQINARVDWTLSNTARLMVRYTQDSWTNSAPPVYTNLWATTVPRRELELGPAEPIRHDPADQQHRDEERQHAHLLLLGQRHQHRPGRYGSRGWSTRSTTRSPASTRSAPSRTASRPGPRSPGGFPRGTGRSIAIAPFRNHQNLWVLKDDYSAVFGKHLLKAGVLASTNLKSEDTGTGGGFQNSAFWGSAGLNGWNANTGNILATSCCKDITFGFSETAGNRQMPTKWNDLEFYVADTWKVRPRVTVDYGVRWSMLFNYYTGDDKMTSFVPSLFNPALGNHPCNGLLHGAGHEPLQGRPDTSADAGTEPHSPGPEVRRARAAPGRRLGRLRDGQDRRAGGPRALLHARADQRRAQLPDEPALRGHDGRPPVSSTPTPSRTPAPSA